MMRRLVFPSLLFVTFLLITGRPDPAGAQENGASRRRTFGIGIIVGEPTGISFKVGRTGRNAIDAAVAWSLTGDNDLHLQGDWLYNNFDLIPVGQGQLPFFVGIGGRVRFREGEGRDDEIGIRIPVGLNYIFDSSPFDAFFEIVPILDLAPDTEFDLNAAIGGRFFF